MTDRYPDYPGHKATDTSQEAAESISGHLGHLQALTLAAVRERGLSGLTANETATDLQLDRTAIQPRLSELRRKGLIRDSGLRRRNASGRRAIVWIASEPVREAATPAEAGTGS